MGILNKAGRKQELYRVYEDVFQSVSGLRWSWERGDKDKAKKGFVRFSRAMGIDELEAFDRVLGEFRTYLESKSKEWLAWREARRANYLGFVTSADRISIWTNRQAQSLEMVQADDTTRDAWDF